MCQTLFYMLGIQERTIREGRLSSKKKKYSEEAPTNFILKFQKYYDNYF